MMIQIDRQLILTEAGGIIKRRQSVSFDSIACGKSGGGGGGWRITGSLSKHSL